MPLLPVLSKDLESVVALIITQDLNRLYFLWQFCFRPGKSVADLHLLQTSELRAALDQEKVMDVVALNIKSALDKKWHAPFVTKLRTHGVNGELL